ncbi:hypothetical protein [Levilactobacillus enshiensis]|uniref:hypothetical protein n=1 Tax=Levilactobacillus enshiensis TaxID=2590213 RepID=UPI001179FEEB|nr:hypothetical protein [Levilactobacillus enshiensis]
METHNDKFRRLGEKRLSRIFQTMNLIANLSDSQYRYTPDDIDELFMTYQKLGEAARAYFQGPTRYNEMPSSFAFDNTSTLPPEFQTAHNRFRRLAEKRMSRVLHDLRLLTNLSDRSNYTFSPEEVDQMFTAYSMKGLTIAALFSPRTTEFHFLPKH